LTGEFNRSERAAEIRREAQESKSTAKPDKMPTKKEISDFVERAFDRKYKKGE
jgi:disulfide oxidoreductase YuzD